KSTAPALIYEEGNLIKRAIRDLYRREIDEVHVAGETGYKTAREFMRTLMPSHTERVQHYNDESMPLFFRYQVETQIDEIHSPTVHLRSGGYIVINPTEAMVSIDVNSGKATKGRHIEETALKTNLEASEEIARQLRLRDQGGLIVIDFIDMEDKRNNRVVERRLRDAMQHDRARIQLGRISAFGLLELSRQRLHPSLVETNFEVCTHCGGSGLVRTVETTAVRVLRAIEEEGMRGRASEIKVSVPPEIALYVFNHKREMLANIEKRHSIRVFVNADDDLLKPNFVLEVTRAAGVQRDTRPHRLAPVQSVDMSDLPDLPESEITDDSTVSEDDSDTENLRDTGDDRGGDRGDRGGHRGGHRSEGRPRHEHGGGGEGGFDGGERGRRRGRRGGRRRGGRGRDRFDRGDGNQGGQNNPNFGNQQPGSAPGEGEQPAYAGAVDMVQDAPFEGAAQQPAAEGGDPQQQRNEQGGGRHRGGRDRHRGGRGRGRDRHRGGDRGDRQHGGQRHQGQHGGQPQEGAPQGASEGGAPQEQAPREHQHSHEGHRHEHHHHDAPRDDGSSSEPANGTTGDSGDGKSRRGWWKRLTE
ncbi:MAG: ribonuclease E/G, partial [Alphaproteobacteria bacterium]